MQSYDKEGTELGAAWNIMPLYHFDTFDGHSWIIDRLGLEFASFAEARREAIWVLPEMARDTLNNEDVVLSPAVAVRDEAGRVVFTARLALEMQEAA